MREKQLDARLETALSLFPRVRTGADIGADHGFLTCALLKRGIAERMWTTDISASSLLKARKLMEKNGLSDRVTFGVGDGFEPVLEPVDAAAILGMGGVSIRNMLLHQADALVTGFNVDACGGVGCRMGMVHDSFLPVPV